MPVTYMLYLHLLTVTYILDAYVRKCNLHPLLTLFTPLLTDTCNLHRPGLSSATLVRRTVLLPTQEDDRDSMGGYMKCT